MNTKNFCDNRKRQYQKKRRTSPKRSEPEELHQFKQTQVPQMLTDLKERRQSWILTNHSHRDLLRGLVTILGQLMTAFILRQHWRMHQGWAQQH